MYLLDTNVVSELRKVRAGRAHPNVVRWAKGLDPLSLFVSVVTIEEIETGIARCQRRDAARATVLREWLERGVLRAFAGRILPLDIAIARCSARSNAPDPRPASDRWIAATGQVHGMTVATRNVADFAAMQVALVDPWAA